MPYIDIFDRMKIDVPPGEYEGMKIQRFEVIHPDDWDNSYDARCGEGGDLITPLQFRMMELDGRAPKPGWYTRLSEGTGWGATTWMSDTTAERRDHAEPVLYMSSTGAERVLINGLGLGMVLTAALSFDSVKHVDVVEMDKRVIRLVGPHYEKDPRVHIHQGDAVAKMADWPADARWDVVWTDIWPDICADNLEEMKSFTDFYGPRCGFHGNWAEDITKRSVWKNRYSEKSYMKFLTEADKAQFEDEDEQDYYDEEEDYDDE